MGRFLNYLFYSIELTAQTMSKTEITPKPKTSPMKESNANNSHAIVDKGSVDHEQGTAEIEKENSIEVQQTEAVKNM